MTAFPVLKTDATAYQPHNPVAEFVDAYGDKQIVHRPQGNRLKVFKGLNTPALRLNRAIAELMGKRTLSKADLDALAEKAGDMVADIAYAADTYRARLGTSDENTSPMRQARAFTALAKAAADIATAIINHRSSRT